MAKRKTKTKPDTGGPTPDFKLDPLYRDFLESFLASGQMGAEFPTTDMRNRFEAEFALRNVIVQLALPVMVRREATHVWVRRTTAVDTRGPEWADTIPREGDLPSVVDVEGGVAVPLDAPPLAGEALTITMEDVWPADEEAAVPLDEAVGEPDA